MAELFAWRTPMQSSVPSAAPRTTGQTSARRLIRLSAILIVLFAAALPSAGHAKYASIVIDADTGRVLHETNADTRNYPASLTKLMTLYLLFEAIENKGLDWNVKFTASRHASNQPPTRLGLAPGDTITAREAALALIIQSANDVAAVVAEELGGTESKFALLMTAKARKIGMSRTTFRNASGLPHNGQMSTARDMALLAQTLFDRFPNYYDMFAETRFSYRGRVYKTHNRVLLNYAGTDGLKTGYTHASGFNLATSVERGGHRLIGVVFGGNTARSRDKHMVKLLDEAFAEYRTAGPLLVNNVVPSIKPERPGIAAAIPIAEGDADIEADISPRGRWGIQVGAFYTKTPAQTIARQVTRKYASLLDGGQISIVPLVRSRGRTLYRARIVGLDKETAHRACRTLKRAKQPCLELQQPAAQEVAER